MHSILPFYFIFLFYFSSFLPFLLLSSSHSDLPFFFVLISFLYPSYSAIPFFLTLLSSFLYLLSTLLPHPLPTYCTLLLLLLLLLLFLLLIPPCSVPLLSSYSPSFLPFPSSLHTPSHLLSSPLFSSHFPSLFPSYFSFPQVPPALTISSADLSQYSIVVTTMERCAMESRSSSSSILNKIRYVMKQLFSFICLDIIQVLRLSHSSHIHLVFITSYLLFLLYFFTLLLS